MQSAKVIEKSAPCRLIVIGGHTRSIGKTQLVCELIAALREARWLAGKITQYGHGVCAQNGENCDCAPTDHVAALDWEDRSAPLTTASSDSARFLLSGAESAFWLRTKQGYLAEGMPLLRRALAAPPKTGSGGGEARNVIIESNSLLQFVRPSLYVTVLDAARADFKESARQMLDRSDLFLVRRGAEARDGADAPWLELPARLVRETPSLLQREGEPLPLPLVERVKRILEAPAGINV